MAPPLVLDAARTERPGGLRGLRHRLPVLARRHHAAHAVRHGDQDGPAAAGRRGQHLENSAVARQSERNRSLLVLVRQMLQHLVPLAARELGRSFAHGGCDHRDRESGHKNDFGNEHDEPLFHGCCFVARVDTYLIIYPKTYLSSSLAISPVK